MKYIKQYENFDDDLLDERLKNYLKYENKYIIYTNKKNILLLAKIIRFEGYEVVIEDYEWDNFYKGYNCLVFKTHISNIEILESFDTFKKANDKYKFMMNAKKYNL